MKVDVVIGSAYGDEGKGHVVSCLATTGSIVVRFNGGCQAGHTVVSKKERRVFSHFGSGTMCGAATYLSRHFVCNPVLFLAEHKGLVKYNPQVIVSPDSMISTPWDVAINIMLEGKRGQARHGSVGVGFGETIGRNTDTDKKYAFRVDDMKEHWWDHIRTLQTEWFPKRCEVLHLTRDDYPAMWDMAVCPDTADRFIGDCEKFKKMVRVISEWNMFANHPHVVFEGAQGLMLDQHSPDFPHVTRSNTGLVNVIDMLKYLPLTCCDMIDVHYVVRPYMTRHGVGPLPFELPSVYDVVDETNVYHKHQGALRFSYLNLDTLRTAVKGEVKLWKNSFRKHLVMTCMDQIPAKAFYISNNVEMECEAEELPRKARLAMSLDGEAYVTRSAGGILERLT